MKNTLILLGAVALLGGGMEPCEGRLLGLKTKVEVCHVPEDDPDNFHTIFVTENAAEAHLKNHEGDQLGNCDLHCTELCTDNNKCTVDHAGNCEDTGCIPIESRPAVDCDDGVACTVDSCDPLTGCLSEADDSKCDDGVECTLNSCDSTAGCIFTAEDSLCPDNECTVGSCDTVDGCLFQTDDSKCPDNECTVGSCDAADGCLFQTDDSKCPDNECTVGSCDAADGCLFQTDDSKCPDNECTVGSCDAADGCLFQTDDSKCPDKGCLVGSCDPLTGCTYEANDSLCDDDDSTTEDSCDPANTDADTRGCVNKASSVVVLEHTEPIVVTPKTFIGMVKLDNSYTVTFDMKIHSMPEGYYPNVLYVGNSMIPRSPAVFFYIGTTKPMVIAGTTLNANQYAFETPESTNLSMGVFHALKIVVQPSNFKYYVNGVLFGSYTCPDSSCYVLPHTTDTKVIASVSDSFTSFAYGSAPVTIKNLVFLDDPVA